ncbi:hypothetical protein PMI14_06655, partial [Acidovorax sp. CF316]
MKLPQPTPRPIVSMPRRTALLAAGA